MPRKKHKLSTEKIPIFEKTLRWLDIITFFDFSPKIRKRAYNIAYTSPYIRNTKHNKPSLVAAACVYLADGKCWIPRTENYWKYDKIKRLIFTKRLQPKKNRLMAETHSDANIQLKNIIKKAEKIEESIENES